MTNNNEEGGAMKRGIVLGLVLAAGFVFCSDTKADDCIYIGETSVCIGMKKKAVLNALVKEVDMQAKMEEDGKASEDIWLLRTKSGGLGEEMKGIIEFHDGRVRSAYKSWGSQAPTGSRSRSSSLPRRSRSRRYPIEIGPRSCSMKP